MRTAVWPSVRSDTARNEAKASTPVTSSSWRGEVERLPLPDHAVAHHGAGDLEVDAVAVVQDEQLVPQRLDVVLDLGRPLGDEDRVAGRVRRVDEAVLGGGRRADADDDPAVVPRRADTHAEDHVGLLVDQHVVLGAPAHGVAPDLERSPGVVVARVEDLAAVKGPRHAGADTGDRVVEVRPGREVADVQVVPLVPGDVDGEGEPGPVRGDVAGPQGEELVPLGLDVLVEDDLLALGRSVGAEDRTLGEGRRCRSGPRCRTGAPPRCARSTTSRRGAPAR